MARRSYATAKRGQPYAIEWPEWHVECACEGCEATALVAELGSAGNAVEAERKAAKSRELEGWKRVSGLWRCPEHHENGEPK